MESNLSIEKNDPTPLAESKSAFCNAIFSKHKSKKIWTCIVICVIILMALISLVITDLFILNCKPNYCTIANSTCVKRGWLSKYKCECKQGYIGKPESFCDECGLTFHSNNLARIAGGQDSNPHSWPSAALVRFYYENFLELEPGTSNTQILRAEKRCGGVLIDRLTVITAAHCAINKIRYVYNRKTIETNVILNSAFPTYESMFTVYLGVEKKFDLTYTEKDKNSPIFQVFGVKKLIKHEDFNLDYLLNDIAIIKLDREARLDQNVQLACLPTSDALASYPDIGKKAYLVGWGEVSSNAEDERGSDSLKNVKLEILNETYCEESSINMEGQTETYDWESQLCCGNLHGGKSGCSEDSGGGIFIKDQVNDQEKYVCAGIFSYSYDDCGENKKPGVSSKLSHYVNWILQNKELD